MQTLPPGYVRVGKGDVIGRDSSNPGTAKSNIVIIDKKPQPSPESCYIMNFLQCQQLSPSRVLWAHLQDQGEAGWQCCRSARMSCGGQAASSV